MSITKITDIPEECVMGRKLFKLALENNYNDAKTIADALYNSDECFRIINSNPKYSFTKDKDIKSIQRTILRHFNSKKIVDINTKYILAYSKLFNCSTDYFFGLTDIPSPNSEITDISKKIGLSPSVIQNLINNQEIYLDEYLYTADKYHLLDASIDSDNFVDTTISSTQFWNGILEDLFLKAPESWAKMACALYTKKGLDIIKKEVEKSFNVKPSYDTFASFVENYNIFHENKILTPNNLSLKEAYDKCPKWVQDVWHDIYYIFDISNEQYETTFYGYSGQFDRDTLNYFYNKAENWCIEGQLPPIK